ncbi:uncharacterized protein FOMMEDRAFT_156997 [Fomitiporia mediterranea MF3/22]|uniref:uncharacterized protein n=1 Tax=Fomitiporia mediterranea (strain MF3/22) TaxID=694068 RepID=UPI0004408945|nr:uncharacterized protein FOMMEDRAFT_156997 [Fomitiporia mediterranea MF3/22]EJD01867.1 hypothetical protein FOMMEDRAFT_156997 [Fomitiporia mediterranea MF3/22]
MVGVKQSPLDKYARSLYLCNIASATAGNPVMSPHQVANPGLSRTRVSNDFASMLLFFAQVLVAQCILFDWSADASSTNGQDVTPGSNQLARYSHADFPYAYGQFCKTLGHISNFTSLGDYLLTLQSVLDARCVALSVGSSFFELRTLVKYGRRYARCLCIMNAELNKAGPEAQPSQPLLVQQQNDQEKTPTPADQSSQQAQPEPERIGQAHVQTPAQGPQPQSWVEVQPGGEQQAQEKDLAQPKVLPQPQQDPEIGYAQVLGVQEKSQAGVILQGTDKEPDTRVQAQPEVTSRPQENPGINYVQGPQVQEGPQAGVKLQSTEKQLDTQVQAQPEAISQPQQGQGISYTPELKIQEGLQDEVNLQDTDRQPNADLAKSQVLQAAPSGEPVSQPQPPPVAQLKPESKSRTQTRLQSKFHEITGIGTGVPSAAGSASSGGVQGISQNLVLATGNNANNGKVPDPNQVDGVSELQRYSKLAQSRVELMDTTIDILLDSFKNKYDLDKAIEKDCGKRLKAMSDPKGVPDRAVLRDEALEENLEILANSNKWVDEQLEKLDVCLREKQRNIQIAGPLVDEEEEHRKEEKQTKRIIHIAEKIRKRFQRRKEKQEKEDSRREREILDDIGKGKAVNWVAGVQ